MKLTRNDEDSGLAKLLTASVHRSVILPPEPSRSETVCGRLAIDPNSLLGHFAKAAGGALVEQGWVHLLGSGNRLHHGLIEWNSDKATMVPGLLLVGFDALGGGYGINRSLPIASRGDVCYFSPRSLSWKPLGHPYDEFLWWMLTGNLSSFYEDLRWPGWELESVALPPNHGIVTSPPLSDETTPVATRPRMAIGLKDLWQRHLSAAPK